MGRWIVNNKSVHTARGREVVQKMKSIEAGKTVVREGLSEEVKSEKNCQENQEAGHTDL